jgi:transposase
LVIELPALRNQIPMHTQPLRTGVTRWEHEAVLEALETRLDKEPERMRVRRQTAEHPFGTLKAWMGHTHFQMKTLKHVSTETSLHVPAYNLKRVLNILGAKPLIRAIQA